MGGPRWSLGPLASCLGCFLDQEGVLRAAKRGHINNLAVVMISGLKTRERSEMRQPYTKSGVPPSPCFPIFLARTTFVLESLPEAKNPGQDAFLGDFVFNSSYSRDNSLLD